MSKMKELEDTLMECPMQDLAFIFQRRLLMQDGINLINRDVLSSIASSAEIELINRMAPITEEEGVYAHG